MVVQGLVSNQVLLHRSSKIGNCIWVQNEMGSEGPKPITINVTGFKKFQGVCENPTETIVNNLKSYVERKRLPPGVTLGTCTVLETAGDGALPMLLEVMESGISSNGSASDKQVVWVSFVRLLTI